MPIFNLLSKNFTYQKKDKLKSRKQMQFLFSKGTAITMHPIRLLYTIEKEEAGIFSKSGICVNCSGFKAVLSKVIFISGCSKAEGNAFIVTFVVFVLASDKVEMVT